MTEESGPPVTEPGPIRPPVIITPPPLSQAQVDKIIEAAEAVENAAKAVGEAAQALGELYGDYCKWIFSKVKPMLIPPIGPSVPPYTPPETTP
jgi:hypothetical protein